MRYLERPGRSMLGVLAVAAFLGLVLYTLREQANAAFGSGAAGEPAPEFALETLDGRPLSLAHLRGQVVLVNFWATWCPPCRYEMPGFERVYREKRRDGFVIVGLTTERGDLRRVREFLAERGVTYPVARATMQVASRFGTPRALPTSFLIDRAGTIRQRVEGVYDEAALRASVERLLAEGAPVAARTGGGAR